MCNAESKKSFLTLLSWALSLVAHAKAYHDTLCVRVCDTVHGFDWVLFTPAAHSPNCLSAEEVAGLLQNIFACMDAHLSAFSRSPTAMLHAGP